MVGVLACVLVAYGQWIQPYRLQSQYVSMAEGLEKEYGLAVGRSDREQFELGSALDLCYERLNGLGPEEVGLWEKAQFYTEHAADLTQRLKAFEGDVELREKLVSQAAGFSAKSAELFVALSDQDSEHFRDANLWLAQRALDGGVNFLEIEQIISKLAECVRLDPEDTQVRMVLARVMVQQAWQSSLRELVYVPNQETLREAWKVANEAPGESADWLAFQLEILVHLDVQKALELVDSESTGLQDVHGIQPVDCVRGDWERVEAVAFNQLKSLGVEADEERRKLAVRTSRMISRMLLSKLPGADGAWCSRAPRAMKIASQLDPSSVEISSLLWRCAEQHAGLGNSVSPEFIESLLISHDSDLRFLVLALSNALRGLPEDAALYLGMASKSDPMLLERLAQLVIWYVARDDRHYTAWQSLLDGACEQNADLGSVYFAYGVLHFTHQEFDKALEKLERAQTLLGNLPAITQLLKQCRSQAVGAGSADLVPEEANGTT